MAFGQFQGIDEAHALEGEIFVHFRVVFVLDVERGDIVGEQGNLVAEEVAGVFLAQGGAWDVFDDIDDKIAGANGGIEDLNFTSLK